MKMQMRRLAFPWLGLLAALATSPAQAGSPGSADRKEALPHVCRSGPAAGEACDPTLPDDCGARGHRAHFACVPDFRHKPTLRGTLWVIVDEEVGDNLTSGQPPAVTILLEFETKGRLFRIGPGQNLHHVVFIDDLIDALRILAVQPDAVQQTAVVAGPEAVTSDQMITCISTAVGKSPPTLRVPLWVFLAAASVMEAMLKPIGVQPPLHRRRLNFFIKSFQFSMSEAGKLGYQPIIGFEEGAARTASWYRDTGLL